MEPKTIDLDQEWDDVQKGIIKIVRIVEGLPESPFSLKEKMMLYTTIYKMCVRHFHDYCPQLYEMYKKALEEYISSTVLPPLREKHDEFMLRELVKRWDNYKVLIKWLLHFFHYLDRNFIRQELLPPLNEVGLTCFRDLVYAELKDKAKDVVIALIDKEREGEQIDRALLKNVLGIFVEIGMGQMDSYENDFERHMLQDTAAYYSCKASNWIVQDSCPDYMIKAEECLRKERDRVSHYLHSSSEPKLVERVQHELLVVCATQLLEKEQSGCCALLREDKVEDLSRIYRLYHKIPKGLEPVANVFKQHITAEGTTFVQQAEDVATNRGGNAGAADEQFLIRKMTELHDKYMEYVTNCFLNHTLFHKALKEAFAIFCNKIVGGSLGSELLATFCDNILKGGNEKLKDEEAIKETIDKLPMPCGRDEDEQVLDDEIDEEEEEVDAHFIVDRAEYDDEEEEVYDDDEEEEVYDDDEEEEEDDDDDEYGGGSLSHKPKRQSRAQFFDLEAPRKKRKMNLNLNG